VSEDEGEEEEEVVPVKSTRKTNRAAVLRCRFFLHLSSRLC
jgi:hypothetical protein